MRRHRLDFVQCPVCTHVWNHAFAPDCIPYQENPNRMFNGGGIWTDHLAKTRDLIIAYVPNEPVIIDIGCGEGHFVRGVGRALKNNGRFLGFDLNASKETGSGIEFNRRYFDPLEDMPAFHPDVVVLRHVLEHMLEPREFVEQLAWGAQNLRRPCLLFVEVPCIDKVFKTKRLADFFYEHVQHFSTKSFEQLMSRVGKIKHLGHGYGEEVVFALVELSVPNNIAEQAQVSARFEQQTWVSRRVIKQQLRELKDIGKTVAIWGGTGKAAAFMQYFLVDADDFPLVVDSDESKTGSYVPGQGQEIVGVEKLMAVDLHTVIIPSQWRARDIVEEMAALNITPEQILIEHDGRLIDFYQNEHPYA